MALVLRTRAPYRGGFRRFFDNPERYLPSFRLQPPVKTAGWYPRITITSDESSISFNATLPHVESEGLDVAASNDSLAIRGVSEYEEAVERDNYHYSEQGTRSFSRVFPLPDNADWERTRATFNEGVLTVTVPLAPAAAPRRIEVRAADADGTGSADNEGSAYTDLEEEQQASA
jgi:HSP20 family protein